MLLSRMNFANLHRFRFSHTQRNAILDAALRSGIDIDHACEMSCACTTCHIILREGFYSMEVSD